MINIAKNIFGNVTQNELNTIQNDLLEAVERFEYHRDTKYCDMPSWATVGEPLENVVATELLGKLAVQFTDWQEWNIEKWDHHKCYPYGKNEDGRIMEHALVANSNVFDYDVGNYAYDESPAWIAIDLDLLKDHGLVFIDVNDNINNYNLVGFLPLDDLLKLKAERLECSCHIPNPIDDEFED